MEGNFALVCKRTGKEAIFRLYRSGEQSGDTVNIASMRAVGVDAEGCYFLGLLSTMTGVNVLDVQFAFVRPILEFAVGVKATPKVMREQVSYCHATVPERCVRITREAIEAAFLHPSATQNSFGPSL